MDSPFIAVVGIRRAPINVLFVARDIAQVRACLIRSGWREADPIRWHSVPRAYFNALRGTDYPTAPLSPWFWNANPQSLGLVQPGQQGHVFDRGYLRVWATPDKLNTGERLFVATPPTNSTDGTLPYGGLISLVDLSPGC